MPEKIKSPILILIVLIVVSLSAAGGVFFFLQKEKAKNVALQEELDDVLTRLRVTENKLDASAKSVSDLTVKLDQAQGQVSALTSELEKERADKNEALARAEQMRMALEEQKSLRVNLEQKLTEAKKESEKLQSQVKGLQDEKSGLEAKIKASETAGQGVELGKIVVSPETETAKPSVAAVKPKKAAQGKVETPKPAAALEGKILVVNKDYNFVVLGLGTKEGVNVGDLFSVYHKNKYIGDVSVEKVHESMSAAGFQSPDMNTKVTEGDKVVRKSQ